jgi:hypothetical protein
VRRGANERAEKRGKNKNEGIIKVGVKKERGMETNKGTG